MIIQSQMIAVQMDVDISQFFPGDIFKTHINVLAVPR